MLGYMYFRSVQSISYRKNLSSMLFDEAPGFDSVVRFPSWPGHGHRTLPVLYETRMWRWSPPTDRRSRACQHASAYFRLSDVPSSICIFYLSIYA